MYHHYMMTYIRGVDYVHYGESAGFEVYLLFVDLGDATKI